MQNPLIPLAPGVILVVGALISRNSLALIARRLPHRSAGGLWEFPGGKIEPGETPEQALVREIREELDVEITVGALASRHTTEVEGTLVDLACYWATLVGDPPTSSTDHDQLLWLPLSELHTLEWSPADVPIVRDLTA